MFAPNEYLIKCRYGSFTYCKKTFWTRDLIEEEFLNGESLFFTTINSLYDRLFVTMFLFNSVIFASRCFAFSNFISSFVDMLFIRQMLSILLNGKERGQMFFFVLNDRRIHIPVEIEYIQVVTLTSGKILCVLISYR